MRILVACEYSQKVAMAFRKKGHEAFSCDTRHPIGGFPEYHLLCDALFAINAATWDIIIAFPPCKYLSAAGLHHNYNNKVREIKTRLAAEFVRDIYSADCKKIAIENPVGYLNTNWKKPSQIIEPYYFGEQHKKKTCLWLKGLPRLNGLLEVAKNKQLFEPDPVYLRHDGKKIHFAEALPGTGYGNEKRSITFSSIAFAMAEQWG